MSIVSATLLALPNPDCACRAVILALVRVIASLVSLNTLAEAISLSKKATFPAPSSPLISQTNLLQSSLDLMSVVAFSPEERRELKFAPVMPIKPVLYP